MVYDDLINLGVFPDDAKLLETTYQGEPAFLDGLEIVAEMFFRNSKNGNTTPPSGEPWLMLYTYATAGKVYPKPAIAKALSALDPLLKMALEDAMSRSWQRIQDLKNTKKKPKARDYIEALKKLGYEFRLNESSGTIEVNGMEIDDYMRATLRAKMRDAGFDYVNVMEDAYTSHAEQNRYHPVRDYLASLEWDGEPYIERLADYFTDEFGVFHLWLRRWLIGAVAKVMRGGQNAMLVLDGPQGVGKSYFAKYLGSPLPRFFIEGPINPDDKDAHVRLMRNFVWEVSELGSTTRRADREALKFFVSQETVTVRKAYDRYDTVRPAMANLIGTVNNESGLFADKTGHRRFLVSKIVGIDWSYSQDIDPDNVWAEAYAAYLAGESWLLEPDEATSAAQIAEEYEVDDIIEGFFLKYFEIVNNPFVWTATADIITTLQDGGLRGQSRNLAMGLAGVCTRLGLKKARRVTAGGGKALGYEGVQHIQLIP